VTSTDGVTVTTPTFVTATKGASTNVAPEKSRDMTTDLVARRLTVSGTVQGVGFRPFVWRLASELGLGGSVRNRDGQVEIDAYGPASTMDTLEARLRLDAPPQARVESVTVAVLATTEANGGSGFTVASSGADGGGERLFPPDLATCDSCIGELFDPADRRYQYPFINCTDCGPRASIIDGLPYDRHRTTMVDFPLCTNCLAEYLDPANRRFHAEPVACAACGPALAWRPAGRQTVTTVAEAALLHATRTLDAGGIVAVKGIGGYHLACDATDESAVRRLRTRKGRSAKPLAVMVADVATAHRLATLGDPSLAALTSPARPIVLAPQATETPLAPGVTSSIRQVGVMLAYTGLHHLLLAELNRPIVLTSANRGDEPIAVDDDEALARLSDIADGFLAHNRRIRSRYEDSVVTVVAGAPALVRRGRGYAPRPLDLPVSTPDPVLAVGAQLKHTFTVATGRRAYVSAHTGDLEDLATLDAYERNLSHLKRLLAVEPTWVAHDLHPAYLSTQQALAEFGKHRRIAVQHHHAHIASCLAEHGMTGPVVGVALDGLGMGDDGTFWGGEVMVADLAEYRRVGRFGRAPMPGGATAVRQPWRMALGYLFGSEGEDDSWCDPSAYLDRWRPAAVALIRRQIVRRVNAPVASSAGRLFDAASSLLGLCDVTTYEGEAAIALEQAADPGERGELPYGLGTRDGLLVYDPRPTLAALLAGVAAGRPVPRLAARFQRTVATVVTEMAVRAARDAELSVVCLSGGVFQNQWLLTEVPRRLADEGLSALVNRRVPANDGGISFGQAAVAAARLTRDWKVEHPCA
jgi:hydrogenase maturation protein HypF